MEYLENKFFLLAFTFGVFFLSRVLQKKTGWVVLNPILLTIAVLILFLKFTGISYETYNEGVLADSNCDSGQYGFGTGRNRMGSPIS